MQPLLLPRSKRSGANERQAGPAFFHARPQQAALDAPGAGVA